MEDGKPGAGGWRGAGGHHQESSGDGGEIWTLLWYDYHLQVQYYKVFFPYFVTPKFFFFQQIISHFFPSRLFIFTIQQIKLFFLKSALCTTNMGEGNHFLRKYNSLDRVYQSWQPLSKFSSWKSSFCNSLILVLDLIKYLLIR